MHRARLLTGLVALICFSYIAWLVSLRPEPRTVPVIIPVSVPVSVSVPTPVPAPLPVVVPVAIATPAGLGATIDELPAISEDGTTIATTYAMGEDEIATLRIVSVATSETLEEIRMTSPENIVQARKRIAEGRFRSLASIPQVDMGSEHQSGLSMLYDHEHDEHQVSILDDDADRELWTDRFVATERGYPARPNESEVGPDCYPSKTRSIASWWDPRTRTLLVEVDYVGWACDCPTWGVHHYVRQI